MVAVPSIQDFDAAATRLPAPVATRIGITGAAGRLSPRPPGGLVRKIRPANRPTISLAQQAIAAGRPFVSSGDAPRLGYRVTKRAIDLVGAVVLLAALSPLMAAIFLVLTVTTKGKPLFFQKRLGCQGRPFRMAKFRTMVADAETRQAAVRNEQAGPVFKNRRDPRVTRFGALLRSASLDELPQLVNVLFGQMSLVGPRPPIAHEVARYEPWQRRRLAVKPGLTCLWQISGRCEIGLSTGCGWTPGTSRTGGSGPTCGSWRRRCWLSCRAPSALIEDGDNRSPQVSRVRGSRTPGRAARGRARPAALTRGIDPSGRPSGPPVPIQSTPPMTQPESGSCGALASDPRLFLQYRLLFWGLT